MTAPHVVLLPSPLLGPAVWAPVADRLRAREHDVLVPALPPVIATPADVLAGWRAEIPSYPDGLLLVPHSNAGLYVAALAAARPVRGLVFVDAGLPSMSASTPMAPPAFRTFLSGLADERGLLPPWTAWWGSADLEPLFPDAATRAAVEREQRRLPLSYFETEVDSPAGWQALPAAYLAFGDTYAEERQEAVRLGWPVETMGGAHLHPLVDPEGVTTALVRLMAAVSD